MPDVIFQGERYAVSNGESVLDCLLRNGVSVTHSCRSGVCQACLMRTVRGDVPPSAQKGLQDTLRAQGYVLACSCYPESDIEIARADAGAPRVSARIHSIEPLNATVMRMTVYADEPFAYRPGQYANVLRKDGLARSYSIASVPEVDDHIEFHVARVVSGKMSEWIHSGKALNAKIDLLGPVGHCFYVSGAPDQPLFLAGTGTGLAPLYGIVRDALRNGHCGDIHLFHGSVRPDGLYLVDELRALAAEYTNLKYYPCALEGEADGVLIEPIDKISLRTVPKLAGYKVYLCGHPDLVRMMQRKTFLAGANLNDIYADAFLPSPPN